ncbi:MAG: DUF6456 domain-containing protein [Parvibaculum sp.]|nr:DUF6456 domain-containing protein [Parvibaculum sp.]
MLRHFSELESFVVQSGPTEFALYAKRDNRKKPVLRISNSIWQAFAQRDLIDFHDDGIRVEWRLSETGRAYWRRLVHEHSADPFRAQHHLRASRVIVSDNKAIKVDVNDAETPLVWLYRRKGANGRPLISEDQLEAGERLRRDHMLSGMSARVTTNWSFELGINIDGSRLRDPANVTDRALAARERLARALKDVGSGLAGVLMEACCNQRGLEEIERLFGWPRRSGKVVLQIALDRLVEHYVSANIQRRRPQCGEAAASAVAASVLTRSTIE